MGLKYLSEKKLPYLYKKLRARINKSAPFPDVEILEGTIGINETSLTLASKSISQNSQLEFFFSKPNIGKPYNVVISDAIKTYTEDDNGNQITTVEPGSITMHFPPYSETLKCRVIVSNK